MVCGGTHHESAVAISARRGDYHGCHGFGADGRHRIGRYMAGSGPESGACVAESLSSTGRLEINQLLAIS